MLIFGAFQILLSQIPDFDRLWFMSVLAAVMSFGYSCIGLGLAIGKTTGRATCLLLGLLPCLKLRDRICFLWTSSVKVRMQCNLLCTFCALKLLTA